MSATSSAATILLALRLDPLQSRFLRTEVGLVRYSYWLTRTELPQSRDTNAVDLAVGQPSSIARIPAIKSNAAARRSMRADMKELIFRNLNGVPRNRYQVRR